jgi:CubicO group peptidase (beta-lactamase class C family)
MSLPENAEREAGQANDPAKNSVREAAALEKYTREDFFRDLRGVNLTREPGAKFGYSNAAAQLLGLILERVYGRSYEELVRIKITGPLKMSDTKVTLTTSEMADFPKGHGAGGAFLPALSARFPAASSLKSTTEDMLKYIAWHLAESDEAVKLSHRPAGTTVWSQDNNFTVGLNWQVLKSSGRRQIFQHGNVPGHHSMCVLFPELNLGIIVLTNEEVRAKPASLSPLINQILMAIDRRAVATP